MELTQDFLVEKFFTHCKRPIYKKYQNIYNAECPVCKEGKSSGRTRRLFYFPHKNYFYCHNCSRSWTPFEWIKEVTNLTIGEIIKQNNKKTLPIFVKESEQITKEVVIPDLPDNSIEISDPQQYEFFKHNKHVKLAYEYCVNRKLFTAINSCKRFFVSLEDKQHKYRLIIPFFGEDGKPVCYQTRSLLPGQFPKYLTKIGEKSLFNINNVTSEIPYIFVFEGPIDSMFVKNGVAMASLSPTEKQRQQLQSFFLQEKIFVFDNDKNNKQTQKKIETYIKQGNKVFIWPREFGKFKDFNEVCCSLNLNEISWKFVAKHSMSGRGALLKQTLAAAHSRNS